MSSSSSSELKRKRTASSSGEGTTQLSNGNSSSSSKNGTPEKQKKAKKMKKATAGDNGLDTKKKKQQQQQQEEEAGLPWAAASAGGFQLVPLPLKPPHALAAAKEEAAARRYLYIRQHRAGSQVDDDARGHHPTEEAGGATLFVANVGDDTDAGAVEDQLRRLFERCGHPVDSVTLKSMRRVPPADSQRQQQQQRPAHHAGGRGPWLEVAQADDAEARPLVFAHVTFSSPDGLRAALRYNWNSAAAAESDAAGEAAGSGRGVNKWLLEYEEARPDPQRVLAEVDAFMADFDRRQRLAEKEEEAALGKPDADGFVTVRRKGRKKVADGGIPIASAKAAPALAAKAQRQESDKVLLDFYRFQRRENRRKQLADLRLRFEEDKKKIAKLRAQRKFKPF